MYFFFGITTDINRSSSSPNYEIGYQSVTYLLPVAEQSDLRAGGHGPYMV